MLDNYTIVGGTDFFVLLLVAHDGSESCYYQDGTDEDDVISGILAEGRDDWSAYPGVTVGGYTDGSLAGSNGEWFTIAGGDFTENGRNKSTFE